MVQFLTSNGQRERNPRLLRDLWNSGECNCSGQVLFWTVPESEDIGSRFLGFHRTKAITVKPTNDLHYWKVRDANSWKSMLLGHLQEGGNGSKLLLQYRNSLRVT